MKCLSDKASQSHSSSQLKKKKRKEKQKIITLGGSTELREPVQVEWGRALVPGQGPAEPTVKHRTGLCCLPNLVSDKPLKKKNKIK